MSVSADPGAAPGIGPVRSLEVVDLLRLTGRELDPLLLEETVEWQNALDWDFGVAAEMVRRFVNGRSLAGAAILDRGEVAGYGYAVVEDSKALIGDLYIRPQWRETDAPARLFRMILSGLEGVGSVKRIESQIMLIPPDSGAAMARQSGVGLCERILMSAEVGEVAPSASGGGNSDFRIVPWADQYEDPAAGLIAAAYVNHIDSTINDQYRNHAGARRFLYNIVRYPGCGDFNPHASFLAFDRSSGSICGLAAVTMVSRETGHVAQLCVQPGLQGRGLGRVLLAAAGAALQQAGAKRVTLTVTSSNRAVELYRKTGFREVRRFLAYVWDRA